MLPLILITTVIDQIRPSFAVIVDCRSYLMLATVTRDFTDCVMLKRMSKFTVGSLAEYLLYSRN